MAIGYFPAQYMPAWGWPIDYFPDVPSAFAPQPLKLERVVFKVDNHRLTFILTNIRQTLTLDTARKVFICQ